MNNLFIPNFTGILFVAYIIMIQDGAGQPSWTKSIKSNVEHIFWIIFIAQWLYIMVMCKICLCSQILYLFDFIAVIDCYVGKSQMSSYGTDDLSPTKMTHVRSAVFLNSTGQ